jgi:DNA-binding NarL/FixJ family response regulator
LNALSTAVLIADDHALVRDGLRGAVSTLMGPVRILEAADGFALVEQVRRHPFIRLALVDLNMPGMERGYRLAELARDHPGLPVVVISAMTAPDVVRRTLQIPTVHAFVPKSADPGHLSDAMDAALNGVKLPFSARPGTAPAREPMLTPRMEEVRDLLRQGMTNKMIASTLGITEGTVKNHVSEIFKALNVSNRTQAAQADPGS